MTADSRLDDWDECANEYLYESNGHEPNDVLADVAEPFPVVRLLEGAPPETPSVAIDRWLADRDINVFAARGGKGKSTLGFCTAIHQVLGDPLFGTLAVARPCPTVLLVPEDGRAVARMILDAIIEGEGRSPNDRQALIEGLVMISDEIMVNITTDTRRLAQTCKDHEAGLLIADPLRTLLGGGDANDNALATKTCTKIRHDLCRKADVTVLLPHHYRKPGKDVDSAAESTVNDVAGGTGWVDGARLALGITKRQQRITVTGLKGNRIHAEGIRHELDLAIEADPLNAAHWLTCRITDANAGTQSETFTPGRGRALNPNELAALAALNDEHEPGRRFSWSGWRDEAGFKSNRDTFRSIKDRLIAAELVMAIKTGKKARNGDPEWVYALADEGRRLLKNGGVR